MRLLIDQLPSPIGKNFIVWDELEQIYALDFEDHEERMKTLLQRHYGRMDTIPGQAPESIAGKINAFFSGDLKSIETIAVATGGTRFQQNAWAALRKIPAGATWSYGQQAASIGKPKASRAVGAANGANPVVIIVPCHRVIGGTGKLTGYGGGLERKQWLLSHERRFTN